MKIRMVTILILSSYFLSGQVIIHGFLQDSLGNPINTSTVIHQVGNQLIPVDSNLIETSHRNFLQSQYATSADALGAFHLVVDTTIALELNIKGYGYISKTLTFESLPISPLIISLVRDSLGNIFSAYPYKPKGWGGSRSSELGFGLDFLEKDFKNFRSLLGEENAKQLTNLPLTITLDFAKNFKRVYAGITFGFSFIDREIGDTTNIEINQSLYAFQLGYKIIDAKKILIMSQVSTRLYRTRLINSRSDGKIPLSNYLNQQDIDLRFLQSVADFGLTIGYKHYPKKAVKGVYTIFGIQSGYPLKLRKNPKINGLRSGVKTDQAIEIGDFSLGIFMRAYIGQ